MGAAGTETESTGTGRDWIGAVWLPRKKRGQKPARGRLIKQLVGKTGFEPATSTSRTRLQGLLEQVLTTEVVDLASYKLSHCLAVCCVLQTICRQMPMPIISRTPLSRIKVDATKPKPSSYWLAIQPCRAWRCGLSLAAKRRLPSLGGEGRRGQARAGEGGWRPSDDDAGGRTQRRSDGPG